MEKDDCIFCKIVRDEMPSVKIWEDDKCLVILDKFPATFGQVLIISKPHIDYVFDLEDEIYTHVFKIAKKIALALDRALGSKRSWLAVQGMDVPHAHVKLYPIYEGKRVNLSEGSGSIADDGELKRIAEKISKFLV